jgi:ketosteroid isomerase-like protein
MTTIVAATEPWQGVVRTRQFERRIVMSSAIQSLRENSMSAQQLEARVNGLVSYIQGGRIIEAMHEFYADDTQMQENNNPPTVGLAANIEREHKFLAGVKRWISFDVSAVAVDPHRGRSLIQSTSAFEGTDGKTYRVDQVAVQTWRDGKIAHEKFYYDPAGTVH